MDTFDTIDTFAKKSESYVGKSSQKKDLLHVQINIPKSIRIYQNNQVIRNEIIIRSKMKSGSVVSYKIWP